MTQRRTLAAPARMSGVGLFTATPATLSYLPARAGEGLRLRRVDRDAPPFPISHNALDTTPIHPAFQHAPARSTNLAAAHARAATLEHALAALNALGVTDATISLDGPECPILDGSAAPFIAAIDAAGLVDLPAQADPIAPDRPITVSAGDAAITAAPRDREGWSARYHLDYGPGAHIPAQHASWDGSPDQFRREIACARTFCLAREAQALRSLGLFDSLSPKEMLVIDSEGPIENTYRFPAECAAHKLLDLVGDLALVGRPIRADIEATRSGHALNHELARALAALAG